MNPLYALTLSRLRQTFREPEVLFWTFLFPVIIAVALGLAFRSGPMQRVPIAILPGSQSALRTEILGKDTRFHVLPSDSVTAMRYLREGKIVLLIGGDVPVRYLFDPNHPEAGNAARQADEVLQRAAGRADALPTAIENIVSPGARYIDFFIPGLLGMNIMSGSMWGLAWAIVQERRRKLLKRLAATPMRRSHYLLSMILNRMVFLVAEVAVIVAFGWLVFDVRVGGSLLLLAALSILGAASFAGVALLIASRTRSADAVSGLMNLIMMPMFLLSGVFFSTSHFPDWMQPFVHALPLTALNDGLRTIFYAGSGVDLIYPFALLGGLGLACFFAALWGFKWK